MCLAGHSTRLHWIYFEGLVVDVPLLSGCGSEQGGKGRKKTGKPKGWENT